MGGVFHAKEMIELPEARNNALRNHFPEFAGEAHAIGFGEIFRHRADRTEERILFDGGLESISVAARDPFRDCAADRYSLANPAAKECDLAVDIGGKAFGTRDEGFVVQNGVERKARQIRAAVVEVTMEAVIHLV